MKNLLNVAIAAIGSPSEVKSRLGDQVAALADAPDQAAALTPVRAYIDAAIAKVSEDDTVAVKATISVSITDAPEIAKQRKSAELEAAEATIRELRAQLPAIATAAPTPVVEPNPTNNPPPEG